MTITIPSFTSSPPPSRLEDEFSEEAILAAAGRILSARRTARGGPPAKLEPCPSCGQPTNARVRRAGCVCGHRWPRGTK